MDMRIVYIANARIPTEKAHGFQIMKMCEAFGMCGATVELILPSRKNDDFILVDPYDYYHVLKNFTIRKISSFDPDFLIKAWEGVYIKCQTVFFLLSLFFYLLFKKNKKTYFFYTRDEHVVPLLTLFSKHIIWECHALPKHIGWYVRYLKRCRHIFVLTRHIKEELGSLGIDKQKIAVSPDAVDLAIFAISITKEEARNILKLPQDKIILGYTGSLRTKGTDKGVEIILHAVHELCKKDLNILFIAVGGSSHDTPYYEDVVSKLGIKKAVEFIPKVNQGRLAQYQKACDILLMPFPDKKHYRYYMSPLKMFEYMASKRPIVASDLPTIREILDEKSALFCKSDNTDDLYKKIELLINNPEIGIGLAKEANILAQNYTWHNRANFIINFIKKR